MTESLDRTFFALSDPTRRAILTRLAVGDATVGEIAAPFGISRPATSKHLNVLEDAGLVHRNREGRVNRCTLDARPMRDAAAWVAFYRTFWESQLDGLARFFDDGGASKPTG